MRRINTGSSTLDKYEKVPKTQPTPAAHEIRITSERFNMTAAVLKAAKYLLEEKGEFVLIVAVGNAIHKGALLAEILRTRILGLHQILRITQTEIVDEYHPLEEGLDFVVDKKTLTVLEVTLTLNPKAQDTKNIGYQAPLPKEQVDQIDVNNPDEQNRGNRRGASKPSKNAEGEGKDEGQAQGDRRERRGGRRNNNGRGRRRNGGRARNNAEENGQNNAIRRDNQDKQYNERDDQRVQDSGAGRGAKPGPSYFLKNNDSQDDRKEEGTRQNKQGNRRNNNQLEKREEGNRRQNQNDASARVQGDRGYRDANQPRRDQNNRNRSQRNNTRQADDESRQKQNSRSSRPLREREYQAAEGEQRRDNNGRRGRPQRERPDHGFEERKEGNRNQNQGQRLQKDQSLRTKQEARNSNQEEYGEWQNADKEHNKQAPKPRNQENRAPKNNNQRGNKARTSTARVYTVKPVGAEAATKTGPNNGSKEKNPEWY